MPRGCGCRPTWCRRGRGGTGAAPWLHEIRRAAIESFAEMGFPTTRQEEWRNTNVAPIAAVPFERAGEVRGESAASLGERISRLPLADLGCPRLVFINGRFSKQLSTLKALPQGARAGSLAEVLAGDGTSPDPLRCGLQGARVCGSEYGLPGGRGIP